MGAKKKGGGKMKKREKTAIGLEMPDEIKHLQAQNRSLEMQLAQRSEASARASENCTVTQEKLKKAIENYENEKQFTMDITRDMTRQYKGMQEELLNKINDRERTIEDLKDELEVTRNAHAQDLEKKDKTIHEKSVEIAKSMAKTEEMCSEFGKMLSDVLKQLKERIEITPSIGEVVPVQQMMEEVKLDRGNN